MPTTALLGTSAAASRSAPPDDAYGYPDRGLKWRQAGDPGAALQQRGAARADLDRFGVGSRPPSGLACGGVEERAILGAGAGGPRKVRRAAHDGVQQIERGEHVAAMVPPYHYPRR
jgi:hypothetical protein